MSIEHINVNKEQFQVMADCMRSDQVPANEMVDIFNNNPQFHEWYMKKYTNGRTRRR